MYHAIIKSLEKVNATLLRSEDALTINIIILLLSSFEGTMVYPKSEDKEDLFVKATENTSSHLIPDGTYVFDRLRSLTTQELQRRQMSITGAGAF